jgi:hypothetical protein
MIKQEKIDFIKEWYSIRRKLCKEHNSCTECPLYESTDGWRGENGKYEYVDNCKHSFEDAYAEEIIDLIEKSK